MDYGGDFKPVENWTIKYNEKGYGYNWAKDEVNRYDSELYRELDKLKNGKKTFDQLFEYAQKNSKKK